MNFRKDRMAVFVLIKQMAYTNYVPVAKLVRTQQTQNLSSLTHEGSTPSRNTNNNADTLHSNILLLYYAKKKNKNDHQFN